MGYEADWLWAVGLEDPERKSSAGLIRQIAENGFNHVLVNVYAYDTTWSPGKSINGISARRRSFPGKGPMKSRITRTSIPSTSNATTRWWRPCAIRELSPHLMLKVYNKMVNWPAPGSRDEERYFQYVAARYQAYSNVVMGLLEGGVLREGQGPPATLARPGSCDRRLSAPDHRPRQRPGRLGPALNSNLDFRSDQQHSDWAQMIAFDRKLRPWPVVNTEFGYEKASSGLPSYRVQQEWRR